MPHRQTALVAIAICALAVPSAAQAKRQHKPKTKDVSMGPTNAVHKGIGDIPVDVNAFFPSNTTIATGGKVRFSPAGFHTVEIPAAGKGPAALIQPSGQKANSTDAAGNPFWFNGQDVLGFNPAVFGVSLYGKSVTFRASKGLQSGPPLADKPKPFTVKFPKAGSFTYLCTIHPGMKGKIKVLKRRKAVPGAHADHKRLKKQEDRAIAAGKALGGATSSAGEVKLGAVGKAGAELFAFVPDSMTVPVGSTVSFRMPAGSREIHTATAGPGNPESEPSSYLGALAASFEQPVLDPRATYPSDPPPAVASLSSSSHGNGFWNSGVLDALSATAQVPDVNAVKFTQAGTFSFYCLVHPFMKATVVVSQ
jgi:plastocyanin